MRLLNGFLFYVDANEDLKLQVDAKTGRAKPKSAEKREERPLSRISMGQMCDNGINSSQGDDASIVWEDHLTFALL